jgi:hypothetical protein
MKMLIQATKKLRDELKSVKLEEADRPPLFSWHANILQIGYKNLVVLINDASAYTVVLYGLEEVDFINFLARVKEAIKRSFVREGIKEHIIEKYLNQFEKFSYQKTKNKVYVARMNFACRQAGFYSQFFNESSIYQSEATIEINRRRFREIDTEERFYSKQRLQQELAEYFGEEKVIQTQAAVLKVELELGEYEAWRKVIVPLNYTFRDLHLIMQELYNWQDYHLHQFFVYSKEKDETKNWNQAEYHRDGYKAVLNLVMDQDELEYNKYDLNFEYEDFELAVEDEIQLKDVLPARLKYVYDYGDFWHHYLETEEIIEGYNKNTPTFLEGEGTAPPEDTGGASSFSEFMKIISNLDHKDYESLLERAESQGFNEYDPKRIKSDLIFYPL